MNATSIRPLTALGCALAMTACGPRWRAQAFPTHQELYQASLEELRRGKPRNAISGFERLTLELGLRDSLLPRSQYYLGVSRMRAKEWLLAADAFTRLVTSFPADTLADDAALESGRAYAQMWREPELDPQYGNAAIAVLSSIPQNYPQSPLIPEAEAEIGRIRGMLAKKDYENGAYYIRNRKCVHCGIIYLQDVIETFPETPAARDAHVRIAEAYRRIGYTEDLRDICGQALARYPQDGQVQQACRGTRPIAASPATGAPPPPARGPPSDQSATHR
jgi:outer membrane protein assembly factor BamD